MARSAAYWSCLYASHLEQPPPLGYGGVGPAPHPSAEARRTTLFLGEVWVNERG